MRKNLHDRILKGKTKEQYLSSVPKSCSMKNTAKGCYLDHDIASSPPATSFYLISIN